MGEKQSISLVYGPPGSGKTTIIDQIRNEKNVVCISVGEISRKEIALKTELGLRLKDCLDRVVEYPPMLISGLVEPYIKDGIKNNKTIILDGFPKYKQEVPAFIEIVDGNDIPEIKIIHLTLPIEETLDRVRYRRICNLCGDQIRIEKFEEQNHQGCGGNLVTRDDDLPEIIKRRYGDYQRTVSETINSLSQHKSIIITNIDASKDIKSLLLELNNIFNICPGSSAERVP